VEVYTVSDIDAWGLLTAHSSIAEGDAWEHIANQQGSLVVQGLEAIVNTDKVVAIHENDITAIVLKDLITATVDLEGLV
jgi:hypothetical protein